MALLRCEVEEGLRATVTVQDSDGKEEFFPVDRGMLTQRDGEMYVSVSLIHKSEDAALVGLPVDADSGAYRIWVSYSDLVEESS